MFEVHYWVSPIGGGGGGGALSSFVLSASSFMWHLLQSLVPGPSMLENVRWQVHSSILMPLIHLFGKFERLLQVQGASCWEANKSAPPPPPARIVRPMADPADAAAKSHSCQRPKRYGKRKVVKLSIKKLTSSLHCLHIVETLYFFYPDLVTELHRKPVLNAMSFTKHLYNKKWPWKEGNGLQL